MVVRAVPGPSLQTQPSVPSATKGFVIVGNGEPLKVFEQRNDMIVSVRGKIDLAVPYVNWVKRSVLAHIALVQGHGNRS